jgi:hypothetical protein
MSVEEIGGGAFLWTLAEETGGMTVHIHGPIARPEEFAGLVQPALSLLFAAYWIEIELPQKIFKERALRIEVVDEKGKRMKKIWLAYPRRLAPADSTKE